MIQRALIFLYAILSYALFVLSFLYMLGFVGNVVVAKSIDTGGGGAVSEALIVDIILLGLFAFQHSLMARPAFKFWWTRIIPPAGERSTYVLLSSLALLLLFWQWRPIPATIWRMDGAAALLLTCLQWVGWLIAFASTFMIDHFDLFGLKQGLGALRGAEASTPAFQIRWLYRLVRHPLMLGFLIAFWATPVMTAGHLLFAIVTSLYILAAVQLEERDLMATLGEPYERYRSQVPMLVPFSPLVRDRPSRCGEDPSNGPGRDAEPISACPCTFAGAGVLKTPTPSQETP